MLADLQKPDEGLREKGFKSAPLIIVIEGGKKLISFKRGPKPLNKAFCPETRYRYIRTGNGWSRTSMKLNRACTI
ncbi:MAG: hypothetical protein M1324_00735 [Patescibacteria group bacterium]|nr:hypothetical protein [Patescibacteria group bacterium]